MSNRRRAMALSSLPFLPVFALAGCQESSSEQTPQGSLTVVVTTDMVVPKDIDGVELRVLAGTTPLPPTRIALGPSLERLPALFPVRTRVAPKTPIHVTAMGFQKGVPVVMAQAIVPFPEDGPRSVRLPLSFLCVGAKSVGASRPDGTVENPCGDQRTCRGGRCMSGDEAGTPYDSKAWEVENAPGGSASCFDTAGCFQAQEAVSLLREGDHCSLPLSAEGRGPMSMALVSSTGRFGFCNDDGRCLIPLDEGPGPGEVRRLGSRWVLPEGACDESISEVVVSQRCPTKTAALPSCLGPFTLGPSPGGPRDIEGPSSAGRGNKDAGVASDARPPGPLPSLVPITGSVRGLTENGLRVRLDGSDELALAAGAETFSFQRGVESGSPFALTITQEPPNLLCTLEGGQGIAGTGDEARPRITCTRRFDVVQIAAGAFHTCALLKDGTARCWGSRAFDAIGNATQDTSLQGLERAKVLAPGWTHTCAIMETGALRCWGLNDKGQAGWPANTAQARSGSVTEDIPGISGVVQVSSLFQHMCAVLADGTVRCWGDNEFGQTAGSTVTSPVQGLSGVLQVVTGRDHTCALRDDGTVRCWGQDSHGQRAGASVDKSIPGLSGVSKLASGLGHVCALRTDATLRCWGDNSSGQTGWPDIFGRGSTTTNLPGLTGVVDVAAAGAQTCARLQDRSVRCWGRNGSFETGWPDPQGNGRTTEGLVELAGAVEISLGDQHGCARFQDAKVRCWGRNAEGQRGMDRSLKVVPGLSGMASMSAGGAHTCALLRNGSVRCWGKNDFGQSGDLGVTGDLPDLRRVKRVHAGGEHTCALLEDGTVRCWGHDQWGQAGWHTRRWYEDRGKTQESLPGLSGVVALSTGKDQTCALANDGQLRCWGFFPARAPGWPDVNATGHVTEPIPGLSGVTSVSAGAIHTCATLRDGTVRCWGSDHLGQTAGGTVEQSLRGTENTEALSTGNEHTCTVRRGGSVYCWGDNTYAETASSSPTSPIAGLSGVVEIASPPGGFHTCARLQSGAVRCWGASDSGQTGGSSPTRNVPGLSGVVGLATGSTWSCAVLDDGTARCWGDDTYGQITGTPHLFVDVSLAP